MEKVTSDLAASVWKVLVEPGQEVEEDAVLGILESMKMEIPVLAECDGTVVAVHVAEGDSVGAGDPLFDVEPS